MSEKRILAAEADDDVAAARDDEEVRHAANSCGQMRCKRPVTWVDPLGRSNGIALERLIPNALGALLQANIHHIRPGANTDGAIEHEGKEFGYVLEGILRLVVNDVVYTIRRGDSFSFASRIPHKYSKSRKNLHESAFGEYASHFLI